jgi:hypothetical protein
MTKMIKRLTSIVLLLTVFCTGTALASGGDSITTDDLKVISKKEVPSNVNPVTFKSDEEAVAYLNQVFSNINTRTNFDMIARATNGNTTVASTKVSTGTITLKLRYSTSGNGNTGKITSLDPYTTFTGFTLGFDWTENSIGATISSSGKDAHVYTDGTIDYYLLVDGLIKLYSRPIRMSGDVAIIR